MGWRHGRGGWREVGEVWRGADGIEVWMEGGRKVGVEGRWGRGGCGGPRQGEIWMVDGQRPRAGIGIRREGGWRHGK